MGVEDELIWLALLLPAGFLAGVINVLAGGGSFITLPLLMATGLPVHIANGTNRISVVAQGLFTTITYKKSGQFDSSLYKKLILPLLVGAVSGAYLATRIDPQETRRVFGGLFVVMGIILLARSKVKKPKVQSTHFLRYPAMLLIGMYGGFIQAGVGLWILLGSSALFGVDALRANSVKLPLTLTFTVPALIIFLQADMVRWIPGLVLALGTILGNIVGMRLTNRGGNVLILRAVTFLLLVTGVRLLFP